MTILLEKMMSLFALLFLNINTFCGQIFVNYDIFVSKCAVSLDIFFKFAHTNDVLSAQFLMELDGADRHGL